MTSIKTRQDLFRKAAENLIPLHCLFELTYRCNLNCVHCYIVKSKRKELSTHEIFNVLKELKKAGSLYITFTGGEPLLRKDFFQIAEYARRLQFALRLFTNAILIDKKTADRIRNFAPMTIETSIYGLKKNHDEITQIKGSFDKTVGAIKLLKERNIKVVVKTTLMQQNIDEIWKLRDYLRDDLKVILRHPDGGLLISPCDDGDRKPLSYRLTDGSLRKYMREEIKEIKFPKRVKKAVQDNDTEALCGVGLISCNITPYGDVNPCVQIRLKNNNLKKISLENIWREHEKIKRIRNLRKSERKECRGCEFIDYCFLCPGIALLEQGSLTAKLPEACRQAKIRKDVFEGIRNGKNNNGP